MCAGRGSRLSQILQHTSEIKTKGIGFDPDSNPPQNPAELSILGVGDYATYLLGESESIKHTRSRLNTDYLDQSSFHGDPLDARISVNASSDDGTRLRQLLEKLELSLGAPGVLLRLNPFCRFDCRADGWLHLIKVRFFDLGRRAARPASLRVLRYCVRSPVG
jgi:hypothetical protein